MTAVAVREPADAHVRAVGSPTVTPRSRKLVTLRPGWPLTGFLVGYPVWWVLGIDQLLVIGSAAVMALELARRRHVRVQRGFGWWLLFLAWASVGVFMLQVNAPYAVPGSSGTRYFTFTYRMALYLAATVFLLYIYNTRDRLSTTRILRAFSCFFVTVVFGGVLGALFPLVDFKSAVELLLPARITKTGYVHDLVHPVLAQVVTGPSGVVNPRTSAPFAYTNGWALAYACLLPFFLVGWLGPSAGWRRFAAPVILAISTYPVVMSRNRGLWFDLVLLAIVLCIRSLINGNVRFTAGFVGAVVLGGVVLASTPLGSTIGTRLSSKGSEGGRGSLSRQTLGSVTAKSPVVGLGTTRTYQGSFYSIAGGDNPDCPSGCTPPPLGTQGHFWLLVFTTGWGGCLLYLLVIFMQFIKHIRIRTPVAVLGTSVLLGHLVTIAIYDTVGIWECIILGAIGLLWREQAASRRSSVPDPTLAGYFRLLRDNRALMVCCVAVGIVGGVLFQGVHGVQYEAISTIEIPEDANAFVPADRTDSMDTIAQLLHSRAVLTAASAAAGEQIGESDKRLYVTAHPNTRLLDIHFIGTGRARARQVTSAAATAILAARRGVQAGALEDAAAAIRSHRDALSKAEADLVALPLRKTAGAARDRERASLIAAIQDDSTQLLAIASQPIVPGRVVQSLPASKVSGTWLVPALSGAMLGLLAGVGLAMARHFVGGRTGARARGTVVVRLSPSAAAGHAGFQRAVAVLSGAGVRHVLSATAAPSDDTRSALERALARTPRPEAGAEPVGNVAILADDRTRQRDVDLLAYRLRRAGAAVTSLVLLQPDRSTKHRIHPGPSQPGVDKA